MIIHLLKTQNVSNFRKNNFLSCFIAMLYLKV